MPTTDQVDVIEDLIVRIEKLERRLAELEGEACSQSSISLASASLRASDRSGSSPANPSRRAAVATAGPAPDPAQPLQDDDIPELPVLEIRGFADGNFRATDLQGETTSFALGQLDLFMTSRLSDKLSVFGELVFEAGDDNLFVVDLERILLQYALNDYVNFAFGRYHTAIGYYNTAYHHGSWFETAAERPFIFAFEDEDGILPIHNVGLEVKGSIPSGRLGLQYIAEVGNGRASRSPEDEAVQNVVDENNRKAVNVGLLARPEAVPGLQAGFSLYYDKLAPEGLPRIEETIMAASAIYLTPNFEFLNEALLIRHEPSGEIDTFHTPAFYTQVSHQFGSLRPYLRYQYVNAPDSDPVFGDVGRRNGPSLGLRYDIGEFAAIKAQYDRTERRRLDAVNDFILQFAYTF